MLVALGTGRGPNDSQWRMVGFLSSDGIRGMCLFLSPSMLGSGKITVHSAEDEIEASGETVMEPQTLGLGVTREPKVNRNMSEESREGGSG